MTKNLFFVFLLFSGASQFHAADYPETSFSKSAFTVPANVMVTNINQTSAAVTWDAIPGAIGYTVRWRPVGGGAWTTASIPAGTTVLNLTNLQQCTGYTVQVIDNVSNDMSNEVTFYTQLNYCQSGSTDISLVHLSKVSMTTFSFPQMTSLSGASTYTDYRADPTRRIKLALGTAGNVLSVEHTWTGTPGTVYVRAWIDFNANGIFEASEMMMSTSVNSSLPKTSTFAVPSMSTISIPPCGTTMRVMSSQMIPTSACGTFTYGEVEDYGITLVNSILAVDEALKSKEISIYPNPASDILNISGLSNEADYQIFSVSGQKTGKGRTLEGTVNINHLTKGVYFIQIKDKEDRTRLKFIKK